MYIEKKVLNYFKERMETVYIDREDAIYDLRDTGYAQDDLNKNTNKELTMIYNSVFECEGDGSYIVISEEG